MAIANYEALNRLLKEGEYNVSVTVGKSSNHTVSSYRELVRDSLGGNIVHSDRIITFFVKAIDRRGLMMCRSLKVKGNELISNINSCFEESVAIRIEKIAKKSILTWIIVR